MLWVQVPPLAFLNSSVLGCVKWLQLRCWYGNPGVFQSGQMGQTVNLVAYAFAGSNPAAPTLVFREDFC